MSERLKREKLSTVMKNPRFLEMLKEQGIKDVSEFTCYNCKYQESCMFAYDPYNTNGDCLKYK